MRKAARVKQPAPCEFCGTLIRCDMYRHVARCHLDLAQLWRCPVSWCTVWKGAPQDLMDHVRGAHKVPEEVQYIRLETLFPPWTVTHQVYTDSLTPRHSGISNDVLLFSDIGLSLVHHYRVHKRGLPHVAFHRNYMSQFRTLLPLPVVLPIEGGSPDLACSSVVESPDVVCASPRPSRRAFARRRPTRVMETPVRIAPRLTIQGPLAAAGAVVLDCRPQVLLEYVGAPESARLTSRSPEYWVHYMGREKALSAALQLQHNAGLILSNVQVLQQLVTVLSRTLSDVLRATSDAILQSPPRGPLHDGDGSVYTTTGCTRGAFPM